MNFYFNEKSKINSYQTERIKIEREKINKIETTSNREKNETRSFFRKNQLSWYNFTKTNRESTKTQIIFQWGAKTLYHHRMWRH